MGLQTVTRVSGGDKRLQWVNKGLHEVTGGYKGLQGMTTGYKGIQRVTRGYRE